MGRALGCQTVSAFYRMDEGAGILLLEHTAAVVGMETLRLKFPKLEQAANIGGEWS